MIEFKDIQKLCDQIVEGFQPEKVILFGSYAYGVPTEDSDVDLLVVMPVEPDSYKAVEIRKATHHPFPLDLVVRTPEEVVWRYQGYDPLIRCALDEGKVLYERIAGESFGAAKDYPGVAQESG